MRSFGQISALNTANVHLSSWRIDALLRDTIPTAQIPHARHSWSGAHFYASLDSSAQLNGKSASEDDDFNQYRMVLHLSPRWSSALRLQAASMQCCLIGPGDVARHWNWWVGLKQNNGLITQRRPLDEGGNAHWVIPVDRRECFAQIQVLEPAQYMKSPEYLARLA